MIKTIIFDFDDTIYTGENWDYWQDYVKWAFVSCLNEESEYDEIYNKYGIGKNKNFPPKEMVKVARKEGLDVKKLVAYLNAYIYPHKFEDMKILPKELFVKLKQKYSLFVASMSVKPYLDYYLEEFGIGSDKFEGVYNMDLMEEEPSKGTIYKRILEEKNLKPEEVLVVGDNYDTDIKPAEEMGLNCFQYDKKEDSLYDFFEKNNILDCNEFRK